MTRAESDADILVRTDKSLAYLGKTSSAREIWMDRDDMTRHMLVAGSTGSGKTEFLLGLCANALAAGSGLLFVDGKGDIGNFAKINALAERFGRTEDVLLLNFSKSVPCGGSAGEMVSHTLSSMRDMPTDALVQLLVGLLDDAGRSDPMWHNRAVAMMSAVLRALCWLRDKGILALTPSVAREHMGLTQIIKLADECQHPDMPSGIRASLRAYLSSIPGYTPGSSSQTGTARDQHGYLEMQTTKLFSALSDDYGHIFDQATGNIDMADVVLNRRILVVLLPPLEKSTTEVANLGRIVVALLKNMMATAMATPVEGSWADVVENRATNADYPFLAIMDEASHYLTDGMALMAGQARSLGFFLVFAVQDVVSMLQKNQAEAEGIMANTNTKVFMATANPGSFEMKGYLPDGDASDVARARLSYLKDMHTYGSVHGEKRRIGPELERLHEEILERLDVVGVPERILKSLQPGEFLLIRGSPFLKGRSLYVSPDLPRNPIRLNRFVAWDRELQPARRKAALSVGLTTIEDVMPHASIVSAYKGVSFLGWVEAAKRAFSVLARQPEPQKAVSPRFVSIED